MKKLLFALLAAAPLLHAAQQLSPGEPFALTNTQYGTAAGQPLLKTNGRDFLLFWQTASNLRVTKLVEGEPRAGRHVLDNGGFNAAVTWTGTHFLAVSTDPGGMVGRLLDAAGEPAGETFRILDEALGAPVVASNGRTVLLLYTDGFGLHAMALTPEGRPTGVGARLMSPAPADRSFDLASNGDGFVAVFPHWTGVLAITFDGEGRERSRTIPYPGAVQQASVASDGRDYVAAWQVWNDGSSVRAGRLLADGTPGPEMLVEPPTPDRAFAGPLQVAWTGVNWAIAYAKERLVGGDPGLRVAYVDIATREVIRAEDHGTGIHPQLAAANGRVLMTWRPSRLLARPAVASLVAPLAGVPVPVTYAAPGQEMVATASGPHAALAVWNELEEGGSKLRAGIRDAGGDWIEREIAPQGAFDGVAATNGSGFAVATGGDAPQIVLLDTTSRVVGGPRPLPFQPVAIAWTGTHYLVADSTSIARLDSNGFISARVTQSMLVKALASNGTVTMAVMIPPSCASTGCFEYGRPRFARIGPDLSPIEAPRLVTANEGDVSYRFQLVWDGTRFVAAWNDSAKLTVAALPLDGGPATVLATFRARWIRTNVRMAAVAGGVALAWHEEEALDTVPHSRVAMVRHDNSVSSVRFDDGLPIIRTGRVVGLPDGAIGHLSTIPQLAAPHHGSTRVVLRVLDNVLPQKPEAPRLTGKLRDGRVDLAWSAPPHATGYRIEYQIGDGAWNEVDAWFDANDQEITIAWELRERVPYQFRIRAFNNAGPGDYSAPVRVNLQKRRAVR